MSKIFMKAPDGATSASFQGEVLTVDDSGFILVPEEASAVFIGFGYVVQPKPGAAVPVDPPTDPALPLFAPPADPGLPPLDPPANGGKPTKGGK